MNYFLPWCKRFYNLYFRLKSVNGAFFLSRFTANDKMKSMEKVHWEKDHLVLPAYNLRLHKKDLVVLNGDIDLICKAAKDYEMEKIADKKIRLHTRKNGKPVKVDLENFDAYFAFDEIFAEELYDFYINKEFVVFDVGMNIGAASLFFATYDNIHKIYGFEPFAETFNRAKSNFCINQELAGKIEAANCGLSDEDKAISVPFTYEGSLGASTTGFMIEHIAGEKSIKSSDVKVELKRAKILIEEAMMSYPGYSILLKLDCEGAEYEIMDDLAANGTLQRISFIIIEWHYKGKEPLVKLLREAGFRIIAPNRKEHMPIGLIYAIKE